MIDAAIISDLHLTDKAADEFKWKVFPWILDVIEEHQLDDLFILGDLFDKKDRHPAELVNRLVRELRPIRKVVPITILMGNHDYFKPDSPFLEFVDDLPNVTFITQPVEFKGALWLPHERNPEEAWEGIDIINQETIFLHQSIIGSVTSNYFELNHGISQSYFSESKATIYSGDIHVPQKVGNVTYIGTPYPVAFGDHYEPRGVILRDNAMDSVHMKTIQKLSISIEHPDDLDDWKIYAGDQAIVKVTLPESDLHNWIQYRDEVKKYFKDIGADLHDLKLTKVESTKKKKKLDKKDAQTILNWKKDDVLKKFSETEELNKETLAAGLELLNE